MKILSPKAAKELNLKSIPDFVFEAFNNLLIKNYDDCCVILHVTEEIIKVCTIPGGISEDDIYRNGWLNMNIEEMDGTLNMSVMEIFLNSFLSLKDNIIKSTYSGLDN